MKYYEIVDCIISINICSKLEHIWSPFQKKDEIVQPNIQLTWQRYVPFIYGVQRIDPKYSDHILKQDTAILFSNSNWTEANLYADTIDSTNSLLILMLYSYLVTRRTLLMHSSLVDYKGNGIMFLGHSGIGKTTQAELWNHYTGASILNGDMVFVRENEDGFYGYGSPWHGSSPYYLNAKVKLKALVTLEQAPENTIKKCSGFDIMRGMMDQVFLPYWYPEAMDACLDTLDAVLTQLPVYHLACRPDEDAVQLLKNELQL